MGGSQEHQQKLEADNLHHSHSQHTCDVESLQLPPNILSALSKRDKPDQEVQLVDFTYPPLKLKSMLDKNCSRHIAIPGLVCHISQTI